MAKTWSRSEVTVEPVDSDEEAWVVECDCGYISFHESDGAAESDAERHGSVCDLNE